MLFVISLSRFHLPQKADKNCRLPLAPNEIHIDFVPVAFVPAYLCLYEPVPAGRSQSRESLEGGRPGSGRYGVISRYDDSYFLPLRYNSESHERRVHERNERGNPQCDCWRPMFFEDLLLQLLALAAKHAWQP